MLLIFNSLEQNTSLRKGQYDTLSTTGPAMWEIFFPIFLGKYILPASP